MLSQCMKREFAVSTIDTLNRTMAFSESASNAGLLPVQNWKVTLRISYYPIMPENIPLPLIVLNNKIIKAKQNQFNFKP